MEDEVYEIAPGVTPSLRLVNEPLFCHRRIYLHTQTGRLRLSELAARYDVPPAVLARAIRAMPEFGLTVRLGSSWQGTAALVQSAAPTQQAAAPEATTPREQAPEPAEAGQEAARPLSQAPARRFPRQPKGSVSPPPAGPSPPPEPPAYDPNPAQPPPAATGGGEPPSETPLQRVLALVSGRRASAAEAEVACSVCGQRFTNRRALRNHTRAAHPLSPKSP